jgi:hypothetical protein
MTAREQAEDLQQQAIQTLLEERKAIDEMLRRLGHGETALPEKRRGRRPRQQEGQDFTAPIREQGEPNDSATSKQALPAVAQAE